MFLKSLSASRGFPNGGLLLTAKRILPAQAADKANGLQILIR